MLSYSPLRYPGGKARVANFIRLLFHQNALMDCEYAEPYAGGASVALALLYGEYVSRVHINDIDHAIYAFWHSVLNHNDAFCARVADARLDIDEWRRQRDIYRDQAAERLDLGFATFYLNRTNRSGIIARGGVIGGLGQTGAWGIDARFTKAELIRRLQLVAAYREKIRLTCLDGAAFLQRLLDAPPTRRMLLYMDPPYFKKGSDLYANFYRPSDHQEIATLVARLSVPWVVSYDNVPEVQALYEGFRRIEYGLRYTARERYDGAEVMFFSHDLRIPEVENPTSVNSRMLRARSEVPSRPPLQ